MDNIEMRLAACFKAVFQDLTDDELPRASTSSVGEWDSVASLSLFALIEEQLQIQIPSDLMSDLISYPLVLDYVREKSNVS